MPIQLGSDSTPLKSINYKLRVSQFVCNLAIQQIFTNASACNQEISYTIPINQSIALLNFIVTTNDKVIQGKIEPSAKAAQIYNTANASGNDSYLMEYTSNGKEITILIGSLIQDERVQIDIECVFFPYMENDSWVVKLPPGAYEIMSCNKSDGV